MNDAGIDAALAEWTTGRQRLARVRRTLDRDASEALDRAAAAVEAELRRRLGPSYTLAEVYALAIEAERWADPAIARAITGDRLVAAGSAIVDAACAHAARRARDAR